MAILHANLHVSEDDVIKAQHGDQYRWVNVGPLSIHASDAKMVELRDAIDAHLAGTFAKAEAA